MRTRRHRHARVAHVGDTSDRGPRWRLALLLSVPVLSLVLPALAFDIASAGRPGQLTSIAAAVSRFLLYYSGVFALLALTAAVAAGLLATDRTVMSPERRIVAQALHRTTSLVGVSALANHIMLEVLAHRASAVDAVVPFVATRSTLYMGLGTLASDLFVVIIVTGALRGRFIKGGRRWLWRGLHATAYAAWPMGVLHGLLAGRSAKPYVDWSYGACLAAVLLALMFRSFAIVRGRSAAEPERLTPTGVPSALPGLALPAGLPPPTARIPPPARALPPPRATPGPMRPSVLAPQPDWPDPYLQRPDRAYHGDEAW
jgi:hypothetical protein